MKIRVAVTLMSMMSCHSVFADDIYVPGDYIAIQGAIDAANDGDRILVSPGVYYGSLNIVGKSIEILGVDGADVTTVNASISGDSVVFIQDSDSTTLDGITIRDGNAFSGGGVHALNSTVSIRNCDVVENTSSQYGSGVFADGGTLLIYNSMIQFNSTGVAGGGLYARYLQDCEIVNVQFFNNSAANGGGAYIKDLKNTCTFSDCDVSLNSSIFDGGGLYVKNSMLEMYATSVVGNEANRGGGLFTYAGGNISFEGGIIQENSAFGAGGGAEIRSSTCSFTLTSFDSNIADSDCDGVGSGGAIDVVNSTVTVTDIVSCANMACGELDDFSGDAVIIEGEVGGCDVGTGACCGGSACWVMEEVDCLNGGGEFLGGGSVCLVDSCEASVAIGSCCVTPVCMMTTESECESAGGEYGGEAVECSEVICDATCAADINQDGSVNVDDLILVISYWGACP